MHNEGEITSIDDHALKDRPLPLRIIYKTLFNSKFKESPIDKFSSSMNDLAFSLFENKDVIQLDMENLACIAAHRTYPLIFAACRGGDILVIWSQTMRVIAHLHGAKNHIVKIVISPSGDRVVGIDSHGHVIIWRFNLLSKKINVESYIKNGSAMDLCFVNDSSLFAILSKEGVSLEDMLTGSTLASNHLTECSGNWIHFLPLTQRLLVVNAKRRFLCVIDPITKAIINENSIDCTTSELTCSITNKVGSVVCLGTQEGEVILVNARSLSPIITYHPFESNTLGNLGLMKDRKLRMPVSFMNLEDYLVAVSSGGSVTIVTKI